MTFLPVPIEYWDDERGPQGHQLAGATVRLYRQGSYEAELVGVGGEPVHVPPGTWVWTAEAPGYVSTMTQLIRVPEGADEERGLIVPMTPACHVSLTEDRRWAGLDRLDVVSIDEAAVYPVVTGEDRDFWIPRGSHLAYGVDNGEIRGISPIGFCEQHDEVVLSYPEPPDPEEQSLVVSARLPQDFEPDAEAELMVELQDPGGRALFSPPVSPDVRIFQGRDMVSFFLGVGAGQPLNLSVRHPWLRSASAPVQPAPGTVREIKLGDLLERRRLELAVDYQPAREHGSAILDLRFCGEEVASESPFLLIDRCGEPLAEHVLEPGFQTYGFPDLDDGQYLVSARIDDELIPGLGQRVMPYLGPDTEAVPPVVAELKEMHVYGTLNVAGEVIPGTVHLSPWTQGMLIPPRTFSTDERDEYHLYYFARYATAGQLSHFPEKLRDESPEDLPGLYFGFKLSACGDNVGCRTFNLHSTFTGEGRFDIDLYGEEVVEVSATDAATGEPVEHARIMVRPSPAFHFIDGEVLWAEALGMEADSLAMGADGEMSWSPPGPGEHRVMVAAPGYVTEMADIEVPAGGSVSLAIALEKERHLHASQLLFSDGEPAARAFLLAFGEDGQPVADCHVRADSEGRAAPSESCTDHRFVLVHPSAALQTVTGVDLVASAALEVDPRPAFPARARMADADGNPVRKAMLQVRLGDVTLDPNAFMAAGVPAYTTNSMGQVVLNGLDAGSLSAVEVSPWLPYEEQWVDLRGASGGEIEIVVAGGD